MTAQFMADDFIALFSFAETDQGVGLDEEKALSPRAARSDGDGRLRAAGVGISLIFGRFIIYNSFHMLSSIMLSANHSRV
jgi:hypothetical protein